MVKKILSGLAIATLLTATINGESLWTDEAFSAFVASHRTLAACWSTLVAGDSSDLQMVLYYLYLHVWSQVFGQSEIAMRSANIPFIILYSGILVWASYRLFSSGWVWAVAALAPLAVSFASEIRPYFDIMALSLTCVTCLLVYLRGPTDRERVVLPWLVLLSLLFGATFHMLMLLLVPPLFVLILVFCLSDREAIRWQDWKRPMLVLSPAIAGLIVYFGWTFGRGATYDYAKPDLISMGSVLFRFIGLSGYAPNRHYDIPFRPYMAAMAISTAAFGMGLAALLLVQSKSREKVCFRALFISLGVAIIQIYVLGIVVKQQIEFRHTSSLLPLLLLLMMAGLSGTSSRSIAIVAAALFSATWLISDLRLELSPDYRREDFRAAVRQTLQLQKGSNAAISVVADPVACAYYGLDMQGPKPCFPLTDSCTQGFSKVPWQKETVAQYALPWTPTEISTWLRNQSRNKLPVVLMISRSRHPSIKESAWWPAIQKQSNVSVYPEHGFFIYLLK